MSNFTYEFENKHTVLEKYEWDNIWWENTEAVDMPRVLYIGDSISCATRGRATAAANHELLFDGLGTSKAVDHPCFVETIRLFAKQQGSRVAVLFNNGLHGWHLDDTAAYRDSYETILQFLLEEFGSTPVFLVLTTAVSNPERNARVIVRNKVVMELADAYNLPVIDLYTITDEHRVLISEDGVHLRSEGYDLLADKIVRAIKDHFHS